MLKNVAIVPIPYSSAKKWFVSSLHYNTNRKNYRSFHSYNRKPTKNQYDSYFQ